MCRFVVAAMLASSLFALAPKSLSAQTIFTAEVEGKLTRPNSLCPVGAFRCGEAFIDEFGPAEWRFFSSRSRRFQIRAANMQRS